MIVCVCHCVNDAAIARHAAAGCNSFEDLQDDLRVATGCGACLDCARDTFDAARQGCGSGSVCSSAGACAGQACMAAV